VVQPRRRPISINYTNLFSGAGAVADAALAIFDRLKTNAVSIVTRMRFVKRAGLDREFDAEWFYAH